MERLAGILVIAIASLLDSSAAGSCKAAKMCCHGRDSGCVIQKVAPNAIIESPRDKPCYCDHACLDLGDCCDDFNATCAVVDCITSDWGAWSECSNTCGIGHQSRRRFIVEADRNGGKPCPQMEQSLSCQSYESCRRRARHFQIQEARNVFPSINAVDANIRPNSVPEVATGYCATFSILQISRGCRKKHGYLYEGLRVCVRCDNDDRSSISCRLDRENPTNFAGVGRWEMTNSSSRHCHGKWIGDVTATLGGNCSDAACRNGPILTLL